MSSGSFVLAFITVFCLTSLLALSTENVSTFLLPDGQTDACITSENTLKERGECLQNLLESYYNRSFTRICPNFAFNIVEWKCTGCPWRRIKPSSIEPDLIGVENRSRIFQPAEQSCRIADYANFFDNYPTERLFNKQYGLLGVLLPVLANMMLLLSDGEGNPRAPRIFGRIIPEPCHMLATLLVYYAGLFCTANVLDYLLICDFPQARHPLEVSLAANNVVMLLGSLWRTLHLPCEHKDKYRQTWSSYRNSNQEKSSRKCIITEVLCVGGPGLIFISFFANIIGVQWTSLPLDITFCQLGQQDVQYGSLVYSIAALQILTLVVSSCGPPRSRYFFFFRFVLLVIFSILSVIFLFLIHSNIYRPNPTSMLIKNIPDATFEIGPTGLLHILVVALMGTMEPIRVGWRQMIMTLDADNACSSKLEV